MTYKNLIELRDLLLMTALLNDMPERSRKAFMRRFEAACTTADKWLFEEQLPIILGGKDQTAALLQILRY